MNPAYLNQFLACIRFLFDFERALHFITREEAQKNQIAAVAQAKGGEDDETYRRQQSEAEGIETGPPSPHEQDRQ